MKLHISNGNTKLGGITNISLPPVITCRKGVPCATDGCYALKFYKMYPSCHKAWDDNLEYYKADPEGFWADLSKVFMRNRTFRYFVSGDCPDLGFAFRMIAEAFRNPWCEFLCFTKQYEIFNEAIGQVLEAEGELPSNLHLIYSTWEGFKPDNPYHMPESAVITPDMEEIPDDWKICGGNCTECICRGVGCWELKNGETIAFHKH